MLFSGDEDYDDEITSGPAAGEDPLEFECVDCGAQPGEECHVDCSTRWV